MSKFQIYVLDDHPFIREGYAALINASYDLEVCGEAGRVVDALAGIAKTLPDLVLADISLPGPSGLELVSILHRERPHLPILVVSGHEEPSFPKRARAAGAAGFLLKHHAAERLTAVVRQLLSDRVPGAGGSAMARG